MQQLILSLFLALPLSACSVDVDRYFDEGAAGSSGDGDMGDGDVGDGDGDMGDGDGPIDPSDLTMVDERLSRQWATGCIPGMDNGEDTEAAVEYVYSFDQGKLRLDMFAILPECTGDLWVQTLEADYEIVDESDGDYRLAVTVERFEIFLMTSDVATGANMVEFLGKTDWEANRWINLLGLDTIDGVLEQGDEGEMLINFADDDDAISASIITIAGPSTEFFDFAFLRVPDDEDRSSSFLD